MRSGRLAVDWRWPLLGGLFYEGVTLNLAGTYFTDRKSGSNRFAEVIVIRGSTVFPFPATTP